MANNREIRELLAATAYDADGDKLGNVNEVYINDTSGQPDFVEVNHGLFGMGSSLVPLRGHTLNGEELRLAFQKDRIKDAPNIDADAHLSNEDQQNLYRHYSLESTENVTAYNRDADRGDLNDRNSGVDSGGPGVGGGVGAGGVAGVGADRDLDRTDVDRDVNRTADTTDDAGMVRSEERLNIDKDRVDTGEVRLRKYVRHDTETVEVPVEREEVTVERTPVDADTARTAGTGRLGEDEQSVTLHEERVNVSKDTVPVEEVHLDKKTVRDTETVSEDVAKEQIEAEGTGDVDDRDARHRR